MRRPVTASGISRRSLVARGDPSAVRPDLPREGFGKRFRATCCRADQRDRLAGLDLQRDPFEQPCAAIVGYRQIDRRQRVGHRSDMVDRQCLDAWHR